MNGVVASVVRAASVLCVVSSVAHAQMRTVAVTDTNLVALNSVSFVPTQLELHRGAFDGVAGAAGASVASARSDRGR